MTLKIIYKKLPVSASAEKLAELDLCKAHGSIFPLSPGGDEANEKLLSEFGKACKVEEKQRAKCQQAIEAGPGKFNKFAKIYLSSQRCLWVALFDDNARQPLDKRMSLAELLALSKKYKNLKCLNEKARIWQEKKSSGKNMRVICAFGPVARAAQRMVSALLSMTFQQQKFQYAKLDHTKKVQLAMTQITEKGHEHVIEIDIEDFFPSFTEEALVKSLPLPTEAIRQIVLAKNANWVTHSSHIKYDYIGSPPGMPQGSASSAMVATWCVANMSLPELNAVDIINHADNFFIFAVSDKDMEIASNALSSGIAGLPGGDFTGATKQATTVAQGFRMLGCWVTADKSGQLQAEPTEANYKRLREKRHRQKERVRSKLQAAKDQKSEKLRLAGLQDYLRLEFILKGWINAFEFCGPNMGSAVVTDCAYHLVELRHEFDISDAELKPLKDRSIHVKIRFYSSI